MVRNRNCNVGRIVYTQFSGSFFQPDGEVVGFAVEYVDVVEIDVTVVGCALVIEANLYEFSPHKLL